ncbi:hypothetical protein KAR91_13705 [Candidatus Pacearchaeota archaeon]|nr:hypothetical protein [Candidatus Pacearchaeota archaeon]
MNEKDIMNGFIDAPATRKISKPWINFTNDRVISTNGVVMLSVSKSELNNPYSRWSSMACSEPFANFIFGSISDDNYHKVSDELYSLVENGFPLVEDRIAKITPIETTYMGHPLKFDLWQMAPIYNACSFWDKGFFVTHARRTGCLLFKHATKDIEMAIKLL